MGMLGAGVCWGRFDYFFLPQINEPQVGWGWKVGVGPGGKGVECVLEMGGGGRNS
jgi:hypothetical protein